MAALPQTILGVGATIALAAWLNRPRLNVYLTPMAEIAWKDPGGIFDRFRIESLIFVNGSRRKAAEDIRVTLSYAPAALSVMPHVPHGGTELDRGRHQIVLEKVQPRQVVKLDVFYLGKIAPVVEDISSSEGPKAVRQANFAPIYPSWVQATFLGLSAIGVVTLVFGIVWGAWRLAVVLAPS